VAPERSTPPTPVLFIVVTFVAAAVVGGLILYLGLRGQLGTAVP